jgi:DNA mismatch repair protein MutS2
VRKIRNPLGTEEAAALRKAERQAQAQDDPSAQEDASQALGGEASHSVNPSNGDGADREALEFGVVLRLIASLARTPPGRAAVLSLAPATAQAEVRRLLAETDEAVSFRIRHGGLPFGGLEDVAPLLAALEASGGAGSPEEFRPVVRAARACDSVRRFLAKADTPHLAARRERLPAFETLLAHAARLFGADGLLRDDASPALAGARAKLRRRRTEVSRQLEKILGERHEALGDAVVVMRNDRYCLPVLASSRGRVPGIVHDRSGSGQTVFVEPLEVIEANNDLALLAAEERREIDRLLGEFGRAVLGEADRLLDAVDALAALDALEAKVAFGEMGEGRLPEISDDGNWTLVAARHPLLDARFEKLRRRVLGESRDRSDAVPLDFALPADRRLLVVSGPNAGGKTVVLKTAGLFSMLAQCGIPIPAAVGTRLPVFRAIRTEIGDAQAILSDRSTFSSSMERLAGILDEAGPDTLALIDEIGGATDPEEGSAIAIALLEAFVDRGGRALVTTHLTAIKSFAASRADALCAAMEFDDATGRPNYRLHAGLAGRSHAHSVARERGFPEPVIARALEILGEAWQRRERAEVEAENAIERLRAQEAELGRERERAQQENQRLEGERRKLAEERAKMLADGLEGFERARGELARRVEKELEAARAETARLAQVSAARLVDEAAAAAEAEPVVALAREAEEAIARSVEVGQPARVRGLNAEGLVVAFDGDWAQMDVLGKRLRVRRGELEPLGAAGGRRKTEDGRRRQNQDVSRLPSAVSRDSSGPTMEVNVIGTRLDEAIDTAEKALDQALMAGAARLRVIHGHGTGRLRDGLREHFRGHASVETLRPADAREGGNGATILELR